MLSYVGFVEIVSFMQKASVDWLVLAIFLLPFPFLIRSWRWRLLLLPTKNMVRYSSTLGATAVGALTDNLFPIHAGEVLRSFLMKKRENVGFFEAFSSIIVERILDLLIMVALATSALFLLPDHSALPEWAVDSLRVVGTLTLSALLVLIVGTRKEEALVSLANKTIFKTPMPPSWKGKFDTWLEEIINGAKGLRYSLTLVPVLLIQTFSIWLAYAMHLYAMFQMFAINISPLVALLGSMLFNLSSLLPSPPGRIGSYEAFWSVVFIGLGFSLETVFPIGLLKHLFSTGFIAITGSISMSWFGLDFKSLSLWKSKVKE